MACLTFRSLIYKTRLLTIGSLVLVVGLVAISGISCTAESNEAAYLERVQDWTNSLSLTLAGLRIDDYQNTVYPKNEVMNNASQLEPYLRRLGSDIQKTNPPSVLLDIHQRLESLVTDVNEYIDNLRQVLVRDNAPMFYLTPERRTEPVDYPMEIETIFSEHDRIGKEIKQFKTLIATKLEKTTR